MRTRKSHNDNASSQAKGRVRDMEASPYRGRTGAEGFAHVVGQKARRSWRYHGPISPVEVSYLPGREPKKKGKRSK